jgi:hypothetical protein
MLIIFQNPKLHEQALVPKYGDEQQAVSTVGSDHEGFTWYSS